MSIKKQISSKELCLDKIRGSLLGGAIGDALGYPVEFMFWELIQQKYGKEGIQEFSVDNESGKAIISDDTQMTLFTACGLLCGQSCEATPERLADYVYLAYLDWLQTQKEKVPEHDSVSWIFSRQELHSLRAPGGTCLSALASGKQGSVMHPINDSKGCGGVMRIAPVGLSYPDWQGKQLEILDRIGAEIAAITHGHLLGFIPAAFLTHVIHQAAYGENEGISLRSIVNEALAVAQSLFGDYAEFVDFSELIHTATKLAGNNKADVSNISVLGEGWVAEEAVAIAIYCALKYSNDFSKALIASVNHSGDSDSTGAITGNILGAWVGYKKIEEKWKRNLELSDVMLELADDLYWSNFSSDEKWMEKYQ